MYITVVNTLIFITSIDIIIIIIVIAIIIIIIITITITTTGIISGSIVICIMVVKNILFTFQKQ